MATDLDCQTSSEQRVDERYVLGGSLPEAVALSIVARDLPEDLRSRPTGIYSSAEVPLALSENERRRLLADVKAVKPETLTRLFKQYSDSLEPSGS